MNVEARVAIEALRAGVPNRAAVRLMGTDEPALEHSFDEHLRSTWADASRSRPGLGIAGGFGTGKSHFLGYLAEVARTHRFVVSRIVISKETPLCDPARVFEAAVRSAVLPDHHDDGISGALGILRQSREKMAAMDMAVEQAGDALAPVFSALLLLLRRDASPGEFVRQMERFLAGDKPRVSDMRQALVAAGVPRKFDLKLPSAALLVEQRIHFLTALFHAAGYAGWCLLFDEIELIGRYTALRRAMAYAWLAQWMGLDGARARPGIVAAYAITDDFTTAVIEDREDDTLLIERLRLKDRQHDARLAAAAMRHIAETVRVRRLRVPGIDELVRANLRLSTIYRDAYQWEPPEPGTIERTATRTMRQYIKGWITEWDIRRLTGDIARIVEEEIAADYSEDDSVSTPSAMPEDESR